MLKKVPKSGSMLTGYVLLMPDNFDAAKTYSGILFAHGIGQRGDGSATNVEGWMKAECQDLIDLISKSNSILIAPELYFNENWTDKYFDFAYSELTTKYKINPKVIVTGVSLGGQAIWGWGANHADKVSGTLACCCVYPYPNEPVNFCNIKAPVVAYHSKTDPTVPFAEGEVAINKINGCNPPTKATMTPYGSDHSIWKTLYREPAVQQFLTGAQAIQLPASPIPPAQTTPPATVLHADASATLTSVVGTTALLDGTKSTGYKWASWEMLSGPGNFWEVFPGYDKGGIKKQITNLKVGKYHARLSVFGDNNASSISDVELNVTATTVGATVVGTGTANSRAANLYSDNTWRYQ